MKHNDLSIKKVQMLGHQKSLKDAVIKNCYADLPPQLFLQRERAAILAEAQTDDLIKETPKPADQSGQWQESGGEIQWVANDNAPEKQDDIKKKEKEEEDEELDLNKGTTTELK